MYKKIVNMMVVIFFVTSCDTMGTAKKALTGAKKNTTDEFLVKKKDPLILPPDYDILPTPGERAIAQNDKSEFEKLILDQEIELEEESSTGGSIESNILKKIKKN